MTPRIKVCCISSVEEAQLAIRAGVSALGLVSKMPSGPGVLSWDSITEIAANVPPGVASFLLTSSQDAASIIAEQRMTKVNTIQIVDELLDGGYEDIRTALPGVGIVQVIHVNDESALNEAQRIAPFVDALLLDSGQPNANIKTLGGTGNAHDWHISASIVKKINKPVYLAGGLKPENIEHAIKLVRPFGVDVCSGLRVENQLNTERLKLFCQKVVSI